MNNQAVNIEKGIPMPKGKLSYSSQSVAMSTMEIGDSFIWEASLPNISNCAKRAGIKVTCRKQLDGSYRIWRKS